VDYCGLDLAKRASRYCIVDDARVVLREGNVRNTEKDLSRVFEGPPMRVAMEASGNSFWMADRLRAMGHEVVVADPNRTKAIGAGLIKNDKLDARWLARLCQADMLARVNVPSFEQRMARLPFTSRDAMVRARTRLLNTARGMLASEGINVPAARPGRFVALVHDLRPSVPPELYQAVVPLLDALAALNGFIVDETRAMQARADTDPTMRLLQTIPGVGPVAASAFVSSIADPARFSSGRDVGAFLGLVPRLYESGKISRKGAITKCGNSQTRWALTMAASALLLAKTDSHLQRWANELAQRIGRKKACVAVARKLASIMWAVWKAGRPFEPRNL
jgi:transposase